MTSPSEPKIFPPVRDALQALVKGFVDGSRKNGRVINEDTYQSFFNELTITFSRIDSFETKMDSLYEVFKGYPEFDPLSEFCFDLLMINFFTSDAKRLTEDYLESDEWMKIEEKTLDHGTEFLNILLYINECKETDSDITLDDFLNEFLLTDDDLFQDELAIYEPVIKNQHLADADISEVVKAASQVQGDEIKDIFVPLLVYFNDSKGYMAHLQGLINTPGTKDTDIALYLALIAFTDSLEDYLDSE